MIIRIILVFFVVILLALFFGQRTTTRGQALGKLGALLLFIFAIAAITSPGITNSIANKVGVGRGADLLLYCLTVVFVAYLMNQYMHRQDDQNRITQLARKMSIMEANISVHNEKLQIAANEKFKRGGKNAGK